MSQRFQVGSFALALAASLSAVPVTADDVVLELGAGNGFSVQSNGGATERLRVDEATGNLSRNGALFVHTTGGGFFGSVFVGPNAGSLAATGGANAGFGVGALGSLSSGQNNSAFGAEALRSATSGGYNSALGGRALRNTTLGYDNTALGYSAMDRRGGGRGRAGAGHPRRRGRALLRPLPPVAAVAAERGQRVDDAQAGLIEAQRRRIAHLEALLEKLTPRLGTDAEGTP